MKTDETRALIEEEAPRGVSVRRWLIGLLGIGAVAAIVAVAVVARSGADALAELRVRGDIVDVVRSGTVREEGTEGKDLIEGDVLRTDGGGSAQIDFFDGSLTRVDVDTQLALRKLADSDDGRAITITLQAGRIWNRVAELGSSDDRFIVRIGEATVSVQGTTFFVDCRDAPRCYVVEIDGSSAVAFGGDEMGLKAGDCVLIAPAEELARCNERKLGLLDDWVRENMAEDQQLELAEIKVTTPSPSPSPTFRAPAPQQAPQPAAPTPTPEKEKTPQPKDTPEPKKKELKPPTPRPTVDGGGPTPTPAPPTESPVVDPSAPPAP